MQIKRILLLLITFIMVFLLLFTSFSTLMSTSKIDVADITDSSSPVSLKNRTQFTVLLNPQPGSLSILNSNLERYAVNLHPSGGLVTFMVPDGDFNSLNRTLSLMKGGAVENFFSVNQTQPVSTDLLYSNVTPYQVAPFAYPPSLIARAYNFTQAYSHNDYGQGITIGIVDAYGDPNIQYDLNAFDHLNDLPTINLTISYPSGIPLSVSRQWAIETSTDVEWAHAMAPDASIRLFIAPNDGLTTLMNVTSMVITQGLANIISLSWGIPESTISGAEIGTYSEMIQEAQFRGISVVAASGDQGALDGASVPTVNFPASDPYVLSVGGTSLSFLNNNAIVQEGWGGNISGKTYGSGGGYSKYFSRPAYQNGVKNITDMRGVPDVAMDADNYTGIQVITGGGQYQIGGTSIGAPIWSAVIALIDSAENSTIGNPDPLFYQIYHSSYYNRSFSPIYYGSNGYYSNSAGWNPVTGLGTPDVWQLIETSAMFLSPYGARLGFIPDKGNFSGLMSNLSLRGKLSDSIMTDSSYSNSSDFFYVSLYADQNQYVESGIVLHNGTYRAMMYLRNYELNRTITGPVMNIPVSKNFTLNLTADGTDIRSWSGGIPLSMNAFLNFSGMALPYVGESIMGSKDNYSFVYNATFSNTNGIYRNGSVNLTTGSLHKYSSVENNYGNISVSAMKGNFTFSRGLMDQNSYGTSLARRLIMFNETFAYPSRISLSLSGNITDVKWLINGTALNSGVNYFYSTGGSYSVEATYPGNGTAIAYREVNVPAVMETALNVNSSVSYVTSAPYLVTVDNGISYAGKTGSRQNIVLVNGTDTISLSSAGFNSSEYHLPARSYINLSLEPRITEFRIFTFQPDSSVTVGKTEISGMNGTFGPYPAYVRNAMNITVSSPGYHNYSATVRPYPGSEYNATVSLNPLNTSLIKVSGYLFDNVFGFLVSGGIIYLDGHKVAFANSTGYFQFYASPGNTNITVKSPYYEVYNGVTDISGTVSPLKIYLNPLDVSISSRVILSIGRYFPFLFYFSYISWTRYMGPDFSHYVIYVSSNPQFSGSSSIILNKETSNYAFLTGITPFHDNYVILELYLNNSQQYTTESVKISYSNPFFTAANVAITGGLVFYLWLMIDYLYFRRKRNRIV